MKNASWWNVAPIVGSCYEGDDNNEGGEWDDMRSRVHVDRVPF